MQIPQEYQGREQSFLKHRVLYEYLHSWGLKLGSVARDRRVRLCYVDGFAGPWKAKSAALEDTSIAIGLEALEAAVKTWREHDTHALFHVEAAFVEKDDTAFGDLENYLKSRSGAVKTFARHGEFGTFVPELQRWLGSDAGLIFVDPTGWKGAAMAFIAPLITGGRVRDVLVNVMFDHINRFKDDARPFLREQMRDFFGLGDAELPEGLDEERLFALYRTKLKELCHIPHAADLAIPHPTMDRTKFRLVVGGKDPAVVALFRDIERKVIGQEAAAVREIASVRESEQRTRQLTLLHAPPPTDAHYSSLHDEALLVAPSAILSKLSDPAGITFGAIWPDLLEVLHITRTELAQVAWSLHGRGQLIVTNLQPRQRSVKDDHVLRRP
ncbi:MAG: three-Cys-motif partner protein TcmP [Polyangiaceae bacterium]|nr:three-Cys-motif partner protein TcmP [Polyangiaceae bacterium]